MTSTRNGEDNEGKVKRPPPPRFEKLLLTLGYCYGALSSDDVREYLKWLGVEEHTLMCMDTAFKEINKAFRDRE